MRGTGLRRAFEDDASAVDTGARSHLDEVIRREHHVAVMFNHEDRVAEVAQAADRADEALMVAWMQADAGFVEDVRHADESETELRGQTDALGFAAGKGTALAVEGEIVEAGVIQECQTLFESAAGFFGGHHAGMSSELLRELQRGRNRHREELGHRLAVQAQRKGSGGEAAALAAGAHGTGLELQQPLA